MDEEEIMDAAPEEAETENNYSETDKAPSVDSRTNSTEDQEKEEIEEDLAYENQEESDGAGEADSESDHSVQEEKKTKKVIKKSRSSKKKMAVDQGKDRKRAASQPNKRKKIRKILTDDKLKEETVRALKEEEERKKRLEQKAQLAKEEKATSSTALPFNPSGGDFPDLYDLDFDENIEPMNFEITDNNNLLSKTPDGELEMLLSSDITAFTDQQSLQDDATPGIILSNVSLPESMSGATLASNASSSSLSSEVARLENLLCHTPPLGHMQADTVANGSRPRSTEVTQSYATPLNMQGFNVDRSASFAMPTATPYIPAPQQTRFTSIPQVGGLKKPVPQSSEVICISSESSEEDVNVKIVPNKPSGPINISSGSESDDVIFAGTDDNEIVDEDPDVNNSGMHIDDALNQPDEQGRVLVNKNRPPGEPEIFLPPSLAKAVKPHQVGGIRFMFDNIVETLEHYKKSPGFGCILAHSMGLGKTLQVISFINVFLQHTEAKTALCVVPVNTLLNWVTEFQLWIPGSTKTGPGKQPGLISVRLLSDIHKTVGSRANIISSWKREGGVLLMGYEMFRLLANQKMRRKQKRKTKRSQFLDVVDTIDLEEEDRFNELTTGIYENLVNPGPDIIVCDEGHRIKNSQASISQALKQIATRRRIVLTGYPLQNNLMEYWCMVDFVRPNFLGTKQEFSNMFERPIMNGQCADSNMSDLRLMRYRSHVLHSLLKGFVQRRSHIVLRNSLPPKEEYVLMVRFSPWQKKLYNNFIKVQMRNGSGSWCSVLNPIKAFSICCKIWNHPDVLYRTVVQKAIEEQQLTNGIDFDLDLPDPLMDMAKSRRKRKDFSNILLSDIPSKPETTGSETTSTDGKLLQSIGLNPLADDKEKGLNYEWAKELLQDYNPGLLELSGKMMILMEIVRHSVYSGDKLLVFSQSLTTLTLIEEFLGGVDVPDPPGTMLGTRKWRKNESYFRLDGNTSTGEREKMINAFNAKDNNSIHLFLLSTRAGCLGINLVGANRVVIFDISWNPCHDAQAVCRVYRYGQTKKCRIYRLICDQSMEKKIYDRQITKQGMADRVVDELNPIQSLDRQDISKLLIYEDEDAPNVELDQCIKDCSDETLVQACKACGQWLTKIPFQHESLLMDCKSQRLTKAEKRAAQKGYEQEKRASSSFNYSRPSYTGFYANKSTSSSNNEEILSNGSKPPITRPIANVRPMQSTPYPMRHLPNMPNTRNEFLDPRFIGYLRKAGITVQSIVADADIPLPNANQNGAQVGRPLVAAGDTFFMIHGKKGMYIGTTTGRIFALRSQKPEMGAQSMPGPDGQIMTSREQESQVIKAAFSSLMRPQHGQPQQSAVNNYLPQQPMRPTYPDMGKKNPATQQNIYNSAQVNLMNGQNAGINMSSPKNPVMTPSNMSITQQNPIITQQNLIGSLQNPIMTQQSPIVTGQNSVVIQENPIMTQQNPIMMRQNSVMTQQNVNPNSNQQNFTASQQNQPSDFLNPGKLGNQMDLTHSGSLDSEKSLEYLLRNNSSIDLTKGNFNLPDFLTQPKNMMSQHGDLLLGHQENRMTQQNNPVDPMKLFMNQQNDTMTHQSMLPRQLPPYPGLLPPNGNKSPIIENAALSSLVMSQQSLTNKNVDDQTVTAELPLLTSSLAMATNGGFSNSYDQSSDFSSFYTASQPVSQLPTNNSYLMGMNQATPTQTLTPPTLPANQIDLGFCTTFTSN